MKKGYDIQASPCLDGDRCRKCLHGTHYERIWDEQIPETVEEAIALIRDTLSQR